MKALLDYAVALDEQNACKIASLFSEDCYFSDGALRPLGYPDMVARTPNELEKIFLALFKKSQVSVKIKQMFPHAMLYTVTINEKELFCISCATLSDEGQIKEYIIRTF
ncbi:MAG: hypothetical protein RR604_07200 [Eubacterium sp.]